MRPRRPTWQRRGRGTDPTVEVGWPRSTVRGPEAIQNDPEAKQLPRHATESHCQKPPAQERSLAPRTSTALPGPHGAPLSRLAPITANTQSHNWSWRTLSLCVPAPPQPSRATCSAQPSRATCSAHLSPLGTESTSLPRDATSHGGQGRTPHEVRPVRT